MIGKIARHSKYFQFSIVQWISNGKQWKYFHIHVISNKSEESEVDNSSLWIQPLDLGKDLDPGYQVVSKTQTARCPICEVIPPHCGLARDYLSDPKGSDNYAEEYSHDSIFVFTPIGLYLSCMSWCEDQTPLSLFSFRMRSNVIWRNETVLYFVECKECISV